uniref:UDP-glucuronosyltransferase 2A3-like n=1 Tax=Chinchilla lanigera TaxID=34839 RepID=A0A8C2USC2_CHILA
MVPGKWACAVLLLQLCCAGCGSCGKVLVRPFEMSHWLNLKTLLEELVKRGHEVTVLTPSHSFFIDYSKPSAFHFEVIPVPTDKNVSENTINEFIELAVNVMPTLSLWQSGRLLQKFFLQASEDLKLLCTSTVYNQLLMKKLRESKYDVLITDPVIPCGELVAEMLGIPFVNTLRFFMGYTIEKYCGQLPAPPSYVPVPMGGLTSRMTFMERVKNLVLSFLFDFWFQQYDFQVWDQFYSEALGRPTTLCETMGKAEIWLIRTYWDIEFPRPYLPNFEFVGGLHCKPAKPLPPEMEEFVQSSGEDGVVVFSLGSMVKNLTEEKANLIASAFAQIPQKYKENAMRLSRIHHDQPMKPLDRAVFWVEFVMRHKGAKHLRVAAHDLSWFQYHSLDVIGFLLACVATAIFLVTKCCLFSYHKFIKTGKSTKRE